MNKFIKLSAKTLIAVAAFSVGSAFAQEVKTDYPEEYIVKRGDTLWDISGHFLEDPWLWPEIWQVNEQVENPHLIYPGDILRLIYVDGQPRIVRDYGVVKLSPQMRSQTHEEALTSIPLNAIREFFTKNRVVTKEELEAAPYMVAGPEARILVAAGDLVYTRGVVAPGINVFEIFREGGEYRDPETKELLGYRAEAMGTARYQSASGEISRMGVIESYAEILVGDRFLPLEQDTFESQLFPTIPEFAITGDIIAVEGGVNQIGTLDIVAINRGVTEGLKTGDLLAIMEKGETVRDRVAGGTITLPDEQAGMLMIFKTYEKMSFGLVLEAEKVLSVGYKVTNIFSQSDYDDARAEPVETKKSTSFVDGIMGIFGRKPKE